MAGYNPLDWGSNANLVWSQKMAGAQVLRTSDNATDTTETILDSCPIPAGVVQANSYMEIIAMWAGTNAALTGNKVMTIRADSNPVSVPSTGGVLYAQTTQTTNLSGSFGVGVRFDGSVASQAMINQPIGALGGVFTSNALLTRTVDFGVNRIITFCCNWSAMQASVNTMTLVGWKVSIFR